MRLPTYLVKPHPSGDGAQLFGPGLRWPLWFEDECEAGNRARARMAETGGRVVFFDSKARHIITEHVRFVGKVHDLPSEFPSDAQGAEPFARRFLRGLTAQGLMSGVSCAGFMGGDSGGVQAGCKRGPEFLAGVL